MPLIVEGWPNRTENIYVQAPCTTLYAIGKINYRKVVVFLLNELECAPDAVRQASLPDTCTTNLNGTNAFGNVEEDETFAKTGVDSIKKNASTRSPEALKISFYTSSILRNALTRSTTR